VVAEATGVVERYEKEVQVGDVLVIPSMHPCAGCADCAADLHFTLPDGSPCDAAIEKPVLDYLVAHGLKWVPA